MNKTKIFGLSIIYLIFVFIVLAIFEILFFLFLRNFIMPNNKILLSHFLSPETLNRATSIIPNIMNGFNGSLLNNYVYSFIIAAILSIVWILLGGAAKIKGPGDVKGYKIWWWVVLLVGILINAAVFYYLWVINFNIVDLSPQGYAWLGIGSLLVYLLPYYLGSLFATPLAIKPVVPLASKLT